MNPQAKAFALEIARLRGELAYSYQNGLGIEVLSRDDWETIDTMVLEAAKEIWDCYARRALAAPLGVPIRGEGGEEE